VTFRGTGRPPIGDADLRRGPISGFTLGGREQDQSNKEKEKDMKRIKTFKLFEAEDDNPFEAIIDTINNKFEPIGIDMHLQSRMQGIAAGIYSHCGPLIWGEIYNEDGIAIEKVKCELREIILSILFGIDPSESHKYELRFRDKDYNHLFSSIVFPPSTKQQGDTTEEIKSYDPTLNGVTDYVTGIFDRIKTVECGDHYSHDPEYDLVNPLRNSRNFIDSFGLVASLAKYLVKGDGERGGAIEAFTGSLNSLNDPELKNLLVTMDKKLIYGAFNMEGYLRGRGWEEEDFSDLELLRRMKGRRKYT
jgi:hypothetical protein